MLTMQEEPSSLKKSYKFIRRPDITTELRMKLGVLLVCFSYHGQVTNYSKKYGVCRTFLYSLKAIYGEQLKEAFSKPSEQSLTNSKQEQSWEELLKLRLIGKCSLSAISELLRLNHPLLPNSTSFISQFLKQLGDKLGKMVDWQGSVHYASDEIFMIGHQPVLVTVDPVSTTILRMEHLSSLTRIAWENHWQCLKDQKIYPLGLVKDDGVIMNAAQQSMMRDVPGQLDTFHAVAHQLGTFTNRLTRTLDKAILDELDQHDKLQRAVSQEAISKRELLYQQACHQTKIATQQLEGFQFLYSCLVGQFNIFDKQAQARQQATAIEEAELALSLLKTLEIAQLNEVVEKIEKKIEELFNFLPKAKLVQYQLEAELGELATFFWLYAWQNDKKSRKIKKYSTSKVFAQNADTALILLQEHYHQLSKTEFQVLKRNIFSKLDGIVQSSALVETINSLLRPYMNEARNQLSDQQLNVIRFYLNHRVYKRGKRKGFAPIELLRGKKLKQSWLQLLLAKAA